MARKIFKSSEIKKISSKVLITPPQIVKKKAEEIEPVEQVEEIEGIERPRALQVEPEEELPVEEERDKLLEDARKVKEEAESEAKKIKKEAEEAAFNVMQKNSVQVRKLKEDAQQEAEKIIQEAERKANEVEENTKKKADALFEGIKKKAVEVGREEGFKKGEEEAKRLISRLHVILDSAIDERKRIIQSTEKQLIDLVLLITKKVVKVISEKERAIVIMNVREALKKVVSETEITIRVNTRDLDLTTKQKDKFISSIESLEQVTVEEDSRVDPGGCIIETSFGDIDARIQRQLQIIEEKIRELLPIKR